jgi:hypothetical protein
VSTFSESFIFSGKQASGATVLGEGCDIITRETCVPTSLNVNNLGKASVLHLVLFCVAGAMPNLACQLLGTAVLLSSSHRLLIIPSHIQISFCDLEGYLVI